MQLLLFKMRSAAKKLGNENKSEIQGNYELYKNAGRRELPCIPTMKHCDSSEKLNKPSRLKNFEKRRLIEVCLTSPPSHN